MSNTITRRGFLGGMAATALAANVPGVANDKTLPTRVLGRTGVRVSILALGCGSRLLSYEDEERAVEAINLALDLGITYLDTAQGYGNGRSETWVGKVMKHRRKGVFLATKIQTRKGDEALRNMEASLKRLNTDQVDLAHIHALRGPEDVEQLETSDGVLQALYKIRDQKMARFIGVTSHFDPAALKLALERHDFDCTQMALNAALQGFTSGSGKMVLNPSMKPSFETVALPAAKKKNLGVIAMKVAGQDELLGDSAGKSRIEKLLQYSLSLPVTVAVVGMPKLEYVRQNTELARSFKPMPKGEREDLSRRMSDAYKAALDRKFADHIDA